jgi:signal transduction histidine kinase
MTAIRRAGEGLELARHLGAAGRAGLYLVLGLGWGMLYLVAIGGGLVLGAVLSLLWIGLPLLAAVGGLSWQLAEGERRRANRLLGTHLPPVPRRARALRGDWRPALGEMRHRAFWRAPAMLLLKLPVTLLALVVAAAPVVLAVAMLALGVEGLGGRDALVGPWTLGPALGIALCLLSLAAAVVSVAVLEGVGRLLGGLATALLRSEVEGAGPVREMLAERLGDRTLNIAYWLPDRDSFVDERGHRVELPVPGSGRAWTAVEREGRRVAAIVHDAELDATPELVHAAASASALALDNERLKADLRARVEELRVSRRRIVEAADDARRRIERDLHDGAQQRLVALALDLRMLRAQLGDHQAAASVERIGETLAGALEELRELARGIHPGVLADRGLPAAIEALVARAPLPVDWDVAVEERPPPAIEAAAYFVVAESLTNVVKYANASSASVRVRRRGDELEVVVVDEGVGGARMEAGSGLRGLSDRVAALEGELALDSPLGGGTRVEARIPITRGAR